MVHIFTKVLQVMFQTSKVSARNGNIKALARQIYLKSFMFQWGLVRQRPGNALIRQQPKGLAEVVISPVKVFNICHQVNR